MTTKQKHQDHFIVLNDRGLHTRPCSELVKCACSFKSDIYLTFEGMDVNAKSLLGILMLAATKGAKIEVLAEGIDSKKAIESIKQLAENQFYIEY